MDGLFLDPARTADGRPRAAVRLEALRTLWFNTGSRCNLSCAGCFMGSSPVDDRLAPITLDDVRGALDEAVRLGHPLAEVGFTGGEPFLNRALPAILALVLERGLRALVLSNGLRPMTRRLGTLRPLRGRYGDRLAVRVSLDHHTAERHDAIRGRGAFVGALAGLRGLVAIGVRPRVAGRGAAGENAGALRRGYAALFAAERLPIDAADPEQLVLFPEIDADAVAPEVTERCWTILGRGPSSLMCAGARMVLRRRDAPGTRVVACTLLPYDPRFDLGATLTEAAGPVRLASPVCSRFCVLGAARCS